MARIVTAIATLAILFAFAAPTANAATCGLDGSSANIAFTTSGTNRVISTNGCPNHAIRTINPNAATTTTNFGVTSQQYQVPLTPYLAPTSQIINVTCLGGAIGWSRSGAVIYSVFAGGACGGNAVEAEGKTFDECGGHSDQSGMYHYHLTPACTLSSYTTSDTAHSPIMGYMLDGIPIYGPRGANGNVPTDLDSCGGHASDSGNGGKYHYHYKPVKGSMPDYTTPLSTANAAAAGAGWPYTPGCLRGCVPDTILNFMKNRGVSEQSSFASCSAAGTLQGQAESITATSATTAGSATTATSATTASSATTTASPSSSATTPVPAGTASPSSAATASVALVGLAASIAALCAL
jgi:hypothetical protein